MIIPNNYGQATFIYEGTCHPTGAAWTLGFRHSGFSGSAADAAGSFAICEQDNLAAFRVSTSILSHVLVKFGPNETGDSADVATSIAGELGLVAVEPNTAALVKKVTALGGRHGRGRIYFPGVGDSLYTADGTMDPGDRILFDGVWEDFQVQATASDLPLYLLHTDATAPTAIDSLRVDLRAATQRRRLRR